MLRCKACFVKKGFWLKQNGCVSRVDCILVENSQVDDVFTHQLVSKVFILLKIQILILFQISQLWHETTYNKIELFNY